MLRAGKSKSRGFKQKKKPELKTVAVMLVDQTVGGVLAKRLQILSEVLTRITCIYDIYACNSGSNLKKQPTAEEESSPL
jgi:hypothetical protein